MLLLIESFSPRPDPTRSPLSNAERKFLKLVVFVLAKGSIVLNGADINRLELAVVAIVISLGIAIAHRCDTKQDVFLMLAFGWAAIAFRCCPSGPDAGDRDPGMLLMAVGVAAAQLAAAYEVDIDPEA
jgi:hydrogenase/urease accessory protein HupE